MTVPPHARAHFDKLKALQERGGRVCALGSFQTLIDSGHPIETETLDAFVAGCVLGIEDLNLSATPAYLVRGLIPRVGLTVIWGPPKCGKTFWAFDLFMHVALGWSYRGRRVTQGAVVYCALEGIPGHRRPRASSPR